jgi:isocitrate lyase
MLDINQTTLVTLHNMSVNNLSADISIVPNQNVGNLAFNMSPSFNYSTRMEDDHWLLKKITLNKHVTNKFVHSAKQVIW